MGHCMTKEERIILQTLLDEKRPVSYIARKLGCCRQTVYNEIKRGQYLHNYGYYDKLRYSAERGQQKHDYNQTAKGRPLKIGNDHAFAAYIEHKIIVDRYSPAAALAAARMYPFATRISSKAGMDWTADTTSELSTSTLPLEITEVRVFCMPVIASATAGSGEEVTLTAPSTMTPEILDAKPSSEYSNRFSTSTEAHAAD